MRVTPPSKRKGCVTESGHAPFLQLSCYADDQPFGIELAITGMALVIAVAMRM